MRFTPSYRALLLLTVAAILIALPVWFVPWEWLRILILLPIAAVYFRLFWRLSPPPTASQTQLGARQLGDPEPWRPRWKGVVGMSAAGVSVVAGVVGLVTGAVLIGLVIAVAGVARLLYGLRYGGERG